jgi:hypothetical protein
VTTTQTAHDPAPGLRAEAVVSPITGEVLMHRILDDTGRCVAATWAGPNERLARLLASATDLRSLAQELMEALQDVAPPLLPASAACATGLAPKDQCATCRRIQRAHAAIAKAQLAIESSWSAS